MRRVMLHERICENRGIMMRDLYTEQKEKFNRMCMTIMLLKRKSMYFATASYAKCACSSQHLRSLLLHLAHL